ncbi:MAG: hypothetical protein HY938_07120 [Nitrosomonadales bacterium]|nr:hypothetical protein [Nitrosomonadales bacterium]
MNTLTKLNRHNGQPANKQRGVVLFFSLIALVVMSLAAVALIRSVDTNTMIAGNLAFKQSTATSGDGGIENAIAMMATLEANNKALNVYSNAAHPFNVTVAANGYYSNADPALDLFADATWNAITAVPPVIDGSGNSVQYIVQRMCRAANQVLSTANCLFSSAALNTSGMSVPLPWQVCDPTVSPGCPVAGQAPMYRFTARITGPKNSVSYIQSFVY